MTARSLEEKSTKEKCIEFLDAFEDLTDEEQSKLQEDGKMSYTIQLYTVSENEYGPLTK